MPANLKIVCVADPCAGRGTRRARPARTGTCVRRRASTTRVGADDVEPAPSRRRRASPCARLYVDHGRGRAQRAPCGSKSPASATSPTHALRVPAADRLRRIAGTCRRRAARFTALSSDGAGDAVAGRIDRRIRSPPRPAVRLNPAATATTQTPAARMAKRIRRTIAEVAKVLCSTRPLDAEALQRSRRSRRRSHSRHRSRTPLALPTPVVPPVSSLARPRASARARRRARRARRASPRSRTSARSRPPRSGRASPPPRAMRCGSRAPQEARRATRRDTQTARPDSASNEQRLWNTRWKPFPSGPSTPIESPGRAAQSARVPGPIGSIRKPSSPSGARHSDIGRGSSRPGASSMKNCPGMPGSTSPRATRRSV